MNAETLKSCPQQRRRSSLSTVRLVAHTQQVCVLAEVSSRSPQRQPRYCRFVRRQS